MRNFNRCKTQYFSKTSYTLFFVLYSWATFPNATAGIVQWTKIGDLNTGVNEIYVNSQSNIFVSSFQFALHRYNGVAWEVNHTGIEPAAFIVSLAQAPSTNDVLYVSAGNQATTPNQLYTTSNGGDSWSLANAGLPNDLLISIAIDPTDSTVAYVGSDINGIYKTTNSGGSWTAKNDGFTIGLQTEGTLNNIAIAPSNPQVIYAAGAHVGLFKSTDGGDNWSLLTVNHRGDIEKIVVNPGDPNQVFFVAEDSKLYFLTDDTSVNEGLFMNGIDSTVSVGTIVIDNDNASVMYIGTDNGVYEWNASTSMWDKLKMGSALEGLFIRGLALNPNNSQILYASTIEDAGLTTGSVYHFQKSTGAPPTAIITADNVDTNPLDVVLLNGSTSTDSDGSIITYDWSQISGPPVTLTNSSGFDTSFVTPDVSVTTTLTFKLVVTDTDNLTDNTTIDITVNPINASSTPSNNSSGGGSIDILLLTMLMFAHRRRTNEAGQARR